MRLLLLFLTIGLSFLHETTSQGARGDPCVLKNTQTAGTCKVAQQCPKVIEDYRQRRIVPTLCGFDGFLQIVCCPNPETATRAPTPAPAPATQTPQKVYTTKSAQNCARYQDAKYEYVKYSSLIEGGSSQTRRVERCFSKKVPLIVGGTQAAPGEFPHMALIGYDGESGIEYQCGGSLISENFVLSAAHCANAIIGSAKYIRLGEHDKHNPNDDSHVQDFTIVENIPHPSYKTNSHYFDIALFKLDRPAKLNPWVRPICLPESVKIKETHALATGWGKIGYEADTSDFLLKVILDLFTFQECSDSYGTSRKLREGIKDDQQICAGSRDEEKDTCQGDSGGPIQVFHPEHSCTYTIIGVTSFGKGCGLAGQPAVYARVHHFVPWIESVVWPN